MSKRVRLHVVDNPALIVLYIHPVEQTNINHDSLFTLRRPNPCFVRKESQQPFQWDRSCQETKEDQQKNRVCERIVKVSSDWSDSKVQEDDTPCCDVYYVVELGGEKKWVKWSHVMVERLIHSSTGEPLLGPDVVPVVTVSKVVIDFVAINYLNDVKYEHIDHQIRQDNNQSENTVVC